MIQAIILIVLLGVLVTAVRWKVKRNRVTAQLNRKEDLEIDLEVKEMEAENDSLASTLNENKEED